MNNRWGWRTPVSEVADVQPLAGAEVRRHSYSLNMLSNYHENATLPPTGVDGQVIARNLRVDSCHSLWFRREGYFDAYALFGWDVTLTGVTSNTSDTDWRNAVQPPRRTIIVPMYRGTTTRPVTMPAQWN